jgi:hypothetical protein
MAAVAAAGIAEAAAEAAVGIAAAAEEHRTVVAGRLRTVTGNLTFNK